MEYDEYAAKLCQNNGQCYYILEMVGEGATSYVYKGIDPAKKEYAIKIYTNKEAYLKETSILSKLKSNKNIVKLFQHGIGFLERGCSIKTYQITNYFCNEEINFAAFEYLSNGVLFDYVMLLNRKFSEKIAKKIFLEVLEAVEFLHKNGISHGDIKLENIMLTKNFNSKLIDFGFSSLSENGKIYSISGTKHYASPEVYTSATKGYSGEKNDIFSLGVLLFVLITGVFPFEKPSAVDPTYKLIIKNDYEGFWSKNKFNFCSNEFRDLFFKMIKYLPKDRISLKEIKEHPFLKVSDKKCNDNEEEKFYNSYGFKQKMNINDNDSVKAKEKFNKSNNNFCKIKITSLIKENSDEIYFKELIKRKNLIKQIQAGN